MTNRFCCISVARCWSATIATAAASGRTGGPAAQLDELRSLSLSALEPAAAGSHQPRRGRPARGATRRAPVLRHAAQLQRQGRVRHLPSAGSRLPGRHPARPRRRRHGQAHDADRRHGAIAVPVLGWPQGQPVGAGPRAPRERGGTRRHARAVRAGHRRLSPRYERVRPLPDLSRSSSAGPVRSRRCCVDCADRAADAITACVRQHRQGDRRV